MDLVLNPDYQQEPLKFPNCNRCKWLEPTEEEQEASNLKVPHYCYKYYKRIFHRTNETIHEPFLWPCKDCLNDGCEQYIERG